MDTRCVIVCRSDAEAARMLDIMRRETSRPKRGWVHNRAVWLLRNRGDDMRPLWSWADKRLARLRKTGA